MAGLGVGAAQGISGAGQWRLKVEVDSWRGSESWESVAGASVRCVTGSGLLPGGRRLAACNEVHMRCVGQRCESMARRRGTADSGVPYWQQAGAACAGGVLLELERSMGHGVAGQPAAPNAAVSGTHGSKADAAASVGSTTSGAPMPVVNPHPLHGVPRVAGHQAAQGSLVSRAGW